MQQKTTYSTEPIWLHAKLFFYYILTCLFKIIFHFFAVLFCFSEILPPLNTIYYFVLAKCNLPLIANHMFLQVPYFV